MEANKLSYVHVDHGDPGCVYPGITADILMNNPCDISKFSQKHAPRRVHARLAGKLSDPLELTRKSAPGAERNLYVVVTIEEVLRYANSDGNTTCLIVGHNRCDISDSCAGTAGWRAAPGHEVEQKLIDHRIANMVHTASLFVQDHKPEEAITLRGHIRSLIDVCRNKRELLSTAPVVLSTLLSRVFVHGFICEQGEQTVQFQAENELLPPALLAIGSWMLLPPFVSNRATRLLYA